MMAGAAVSLAASGSERLAVWSGVTVITAIAAGIAYESRLVKAWYSEFHRRRGRPGHPSSTS